jgi:ribose-phosphate pyrophosphokinase
MDGVVLLADPESKAWDFAERMQTYLEGKYSKKINLQKILMGKFRNGELKFHVPENVRRKEVYFIQDSTLDPQDWLAKLIFAKGLLLRASVEEVAFVVPDLLYSRQDRKDKPHTTVSAKDVADVISPGLTRLITADLHAAE